MEVFDLTNDGKVTTESTSTKRKSDGQTKSSTEKVAKKDTAHVNFFVRRQVFCRKV